MQNQHIQVTYPEPHIGRTRQILAAHPEVSKLFGNTPVTSLYVFGIVAMQIAAAWALSSQPWWAILIGAWTLGALANHALWVLIHECTHNLVFKTSTANSLLQMVANLPIIIPGSMSFRTYHIKHHIYQGNPDFDADLARPWEARLIGNSALGKAFWLLTFPLWQVGRVSSLKISAVNGWVIANLIVQVAFSAAIVFLFGWSGFAYMALASLFSIGLHPVGARWIQEHYVVQDNNQETYSYYGPLNKVAFNVGFHNEHHDLMRVPWSRLPKVRAIAPEFYDTLYWHKSWTALLLKFIFDPNLSLFSRVTRVSKSTPSSARGKVGATSAAEPAMSALAGASLSTGTPTMK